MTGRVRVQCDMAPRGLIGKRSDRVQSDRTDPIMPLAQPRDNPLAMSESLLLDEARSYGTVATAPSKKGDTPFRRTRLGLLFAALIFVQAMYSSWSLSLYISCYRCRIQMTHRDQNGCADCSSS